MPRSASVSRLWMCAAPSSDPSELNGVINATIVRGGGFIYGLQSEWKKRPRGRSTRS